MDPKLTDKAIEIVDQLTEGLKAVAPQMADLTLAAVRFQGYMNLGICVIITVLAIVIVVLGIKAIKFSFKKYKEDEYNAAWPAIITFAICVMVPLPIASIIMWCQSYMWAAIIDPRIAIALRVFDKITEAAK